MMEQPVTISVNHNLILREVINELISDNEIQGVSKLKEENIRHLQPVLAYACRLHLRAGCTAESKAALKRFAQGYLKGQIPHYK